MSPASSSSAVGVPGSGTPVVSPFREFSKQPPATGLYDPAREHDACGLAVVATLGGVPSHDVVVSALHALRRLEHRGAKGADEGTGDGAGILTHIPDEFFRAVVDFELPAPHSYVAGIAFLPADDPDEHAALVEKLAGEEGLTVLGWRDVPVRRDIVGDSARETMPVFRQLFLELPEADRGTATTSPFPLPGLTGRQFEAPDLLERRAFCLRKRAEHEGVYFPSLSGRTIVYKGMLTTAQLEPFYPDLTDERYATRVATVHQRFSTNTFPSWPLAQPFRIIAHNGEINTVKGNRNWMRARESQITSELLAGPHGEDISRIFPICSPGGSDSASFDEVLELLTMSGRTLPQAVMMMIPEAWENNPGMSPERRAFYEYNSMIMEPWDGPACMTFTDGRLAGAVLDRNGLRPGRYIVTEDGLVVLASEVGVIPVDPAKVVRRGRLAPGKMFLVDTVAGRIVEDAEIKAAVSEAAPYQEWLDRGRYNLGDLPPREHIVHTRSSVTRRQRTFGYTEEELRVLVGPMATTGAEPLGAMGSDTPLAAFTERPRLLFDYFVQTFAQVTNPPLDAIREELVTSLHGALGPEGNLLHQTAEQAHRLILPYPVLDNDELAKIVHIDAGLYDPEPGRAAVTLRGLYRVEAGGAGLAARLEELCAEADAAIAADAKFLVLSDRDSDAEWAPIPSLLLVGAIHHHLIREKTRTRVSIVVEAGDVREVHHVATLIGYGATAVNPYLAMESVEDLVRTGMVTGRDADEAVHNFLHALGKGVLKIMSKMGISTVASYCGAQTFEAIGLGQEVVDAYFTGTTSQLGGVGLDVIAAEVAARHQEAYPSDGQHLPHRRLEIGGEYKWRREGPPHMFNPETVFRLQHSTRTGRYDVFKQYSRLVDDQSRHLMTLRGLLRFASDRPPVPIEEVEPVESIVTRFATGAMSYGSISMEAHSSLARAMNSIGGRSNTGEGGEDPERLLDPEIRSSVKQVASGRFGVTSLYLTHADDLQIKMAQGAKPGEGGQLPSGKVYPWIARTRHATPGVGLISPPPHHDIYSIEDLAQLIYDLKRASPKARIHVKLVSEVGVGTVAAGVAKAKADVVLISGNDGGTGAAPLNSLKHAGAPWELGLAEAQQTLMLNNMRDRIVVQCDGQLKTGRDVVVAALLGAEEFGFATAPLVTQGCIMMRACHLDTCPVGVATQNPELRSRFTGKAEYVVNFMRFVAQEVREYLAELGFRSIEEAVGHTEVLDTADAEQYWKASGLDLTPVLHGPTFPDSAPRHCTRGQDHELEKHFDHRLIAAARPVFESRKPVHVSADITNVDRSVGTLLGHEVTERFGTETLPDDTIDVTLTGSAGQSLGAFMPAGITLRLFGDANDYVAKGLSGGRVIVRPDHRSSVPAARNVIAGNVIGYGATSGELFISGIVGERFLVRNSGATAVVEGIGDHGCEYMTGGVALVLGPTGRNFAAGMSGGIAYVLDLDEGLLNRQAVTAGELTLSPLQPDDISTVGTLLRRHRDETGSMLATDLLSELDITIGRLTKVVPTDYAAVLTARDEAALAGLDPDGPEAWQQILEVTHG